MNMQQLEYFLDAAKTLNFTRTAEKFYISQSAITQQIRNLEQELDVELFYRKKRRLFLTDAGELFVGEARALIERTREAVEKVRSVKEGFAGQLRIGYLQAMELGVFPMTIQNFHMKYPGVKLSLERMRAHDLYEEYINGRFDVVFNIARDYFLYPESVETHLIYYGFSVAMPMHHRLAARKVIRAEDLADEPLILHDCNQVGGNQSRELSWQVIPRELYDHIVSVESDTDTALVLVAAGIGVAILPDFDLGFRKTNLNISYVPLDTGGRRAEISLYYKKANTNPALPLFLSECKAVDEK